MSSKKLHCHSNRGNNQIKEVVQGNQKFQTTSIIHNNIEQE